MKIYNTTCVEGYESFNDKNDCFDDWADELRKNYSIKEKWPKIELDLTHKGKKSDMPFFWETMGALVISQRLKKEFDKFLDSPSIELLPMYFENETYYLIHIINVDDLTYKYIKDSRGNFKLIFNEKELIEKKIIDKGLFRIFINDEEPDDSVYITEKFVDKVRELGLKGVKFEVIWDSEEEYSDSRE